MKIYVRINQRLPHQAFYRCGYRFGKNWRELDVDKATAMRLFDEQMLDVSEKCPAELVDCQDKPADDISKNQTEPAKPQGTASPESANQNDTVNDGSKQSGTDDDAADHAKTGNPEDSPSESTDKQNESAKTGETSTRKGK